ncbi:hypothetical protein BCU85_07665 [Vibrio lentus]|uniref:AAA family ATPase n=1 Tax=Vibrio lentus TaxID=136468 RepID=UPI000C8639DE|nr:DUF3696 domain-containing protein [Vibrio lentus]MCC4818489.1 DUF3696 domain-containing protein [Vibrio lentus]PMG68572.1 hypothetical protein BCU85_07665 [Vibrio lentus]PMK89563.1 hypothetical protein BCT88_22010 [Vibrio lentus]PML27172.1 hypothetical protein BCT80_01170 [Vibrio lentus]PMM25724.1 hypothetical protein BCT57_21145 [Vibrio lentus]
MIKNIKLKNFKSLSLNENLKLNSLSLLCGANSSGKSSLIQSILMLSQTFGTRFTHKSVALNGHLVKLGGFEDVKNNKASNENIIISFTVDGMHVNKYQTIKRVNVEFEFGFTNSEKEALNEQLDPPLLRSIISIEHQCDDDKVQTSEIHIEKLKENEENIDLEYQVSLANGEYFDDVLSSFPRAKIIGCYLNGFIPEDILIKYDHSKMMADSLIDNLTSLGRRNFKKMRMTRHLLGEYIPLELFEFIVKEVERENKEKKKEMLSNLKSNRSHFFSHLDEDVLKQLDLDLLSNVIISNNNDIDIDEIKKKFLINERVNVNEWHVYCNGLELKNREALFSFIRDIRFKLVSILHNIIGEDFKYRTIRLDLFQKVHSFLQSNLSNGVKYLGPLRSDPKSIYPITNLIDPKDIGVKGENAAAVFHINKNKNLNSPLPDGFESNKPPFELKVAYQSFGSSVIEWLKYMGVVDTISTIDKGKFGYELKVKTTNGDGLQDLTHVGVGVSQVVPIVMLCLLSEAGDTIIFEQPELHLHPKVQARLTDFLIAMSLSGRQVIVETHSEYMINRLRYRIALSDNEDINKMSSIYFVNKENGLTRFDDVFISKYGVIKEWPDDFFDQTQNEVEGILIAAANKKKLERIKLKCKQ